MRDECWLRATGKGGRSKAHEGNKSIKERVDKKEGLCRKI